MRFELFEEQQRGQKQGLIVVVVWLALLWYLKPAILNFLISCYLSLSF
jgi:hypothetical protein